MKRSVEDSFGLIWPRHVNNLNRFLIAAREAFDGDLDLFLVLAIIGDRSFAAHKVDPSLTFDDWQARDEPMVTPEGINVRSISHFSGIPRETVRRKLAILIEKGWVVRGEDNSLSATVKARKELAPLTKGSIRYLNEMFDLYSEFTGKPGS